MDQKAKKAVIGAAKMKELRKSFSQKAKDIGLMDDFLFASRFKEYCRLLDHLDDLSEILAAEGYHETVPVGKDGEKLVSHHSYSDYLKTDANAQKLASFLAMAIDKAEAKKPVKTEDDEL